MTVRFPVLLPDHEDDVNLACISLEQATVAAARQAVYRPRSRSARRRLKLAVRAMDATEAFLTAMREGER